MEKHLTQNLKLDCKRKTIRVAVDGEILKLTPPLEFKMLSGSLEMVVPTKSITNQKSSGEMLWIY